MLNQFHYATLWWQGMELNHLYPVYEAGQIAESAPCCISPKLLHFSEFHFNATLSHKCAEERSAERTLPPMGVTILLYLRFQGS